MGTNDTQGSAAGGSDHRPGATGHASSGAGASSGGLAETMQDRAQRLAAGAHETVDRLTQKVGPAAEKLQDNLDDAGEMIHERADQVRQWGRAWRDGLRCGVREHPLTTVVAALALGLLLARLTR